jgi:tetratricopeptide (TPR) repeat protein
MKIAQRLLSGAVAALLLVLLLPGCNKEAKAARKLTTAKEYFEKADYAAAEIEFKNVLKLESGDPQASKGLGLIMLRQGAMLDACRILAATKQKLPKDDEIGVALAQTMFELGFIGDSRKELMEVLARTPAHGEALMLLAEAALTPEAMTECEERIARANAPDKAPVLLASALIELRRGQVDSGTSSVERTLEIDPKFARALALQGTLFRMRKLPEKALDPLKKAADLAGPRSTETGSYAKLLMELDHKDESVALLKQATQAAPDYLPNWRILAQISIAAKNDAEAAEYLSKVLAKSPLDLDAGVLQSQIWIRQKEPAKAVELLEKITKTFPSRPHLELALAKAYLAADDFYKAAATLDRVLALVPGATDAILLRTGLYLKDGQAGEAIRSIEPLLAAEPANRVAHDLLVNAYLAANRSDDAVAALRKQISASPEDPGLQLQLGQILGSQKKPIEARAAFDRVLELSPDHLGAVAQLCSLDQQEGKGDEAMARADAYLSAHLESAQAHFLKARLCYTLKDFKTAESLAQKTIELNPQDITAYGMLVRIQIDDGRSEQAVVRLNELLKTAPNNIPARMQLGILLQSLGRIDEARTRFDEIVKIAPDFALAYNNLACIDSEITGNLDKALENARKARLLASDNPLIGDTLGWIEWLRGNYREALPLLREAANGLPQVASAQYHLAMAHYMMYQISDASALLEKALAIEGGFPEKTEAERRLSILRDGESPDLATLGQQMKKDPKDVVLILRLAQNLTAAGRPGDALAAYQSALIVNPDLEAAHVGEAKLYASALKQPAKALEAATQARKVAPQSPQAAAVLGAANFRLGKHEQAFNLLHEAARKLPGETEVQYDYAWAAYSMGRVEDARSIMAKVAEIDPARAAEARDFLALTAPNAAADPATPALVEKRLAASPADVPALMARAALQEKAGESPVQTYRKVLEVCPQFDPARMALVRVFLDDPKQLEEIEKLANAARERLKDDPELSAILAIVNFRKGKFDYAAQLLKELSTKRPLTGNELFALGMSQTATKRPDEARKSLIQALQTDLPEADSTKAKATLAELDKTDVGK